MIVITLPTGETATVDQGQWSVPENAVIERVLNGPTMQPPENGHYAPSENARLAQYVLNEWGGTFESSDERAEPGKLY